MGQYPFGIKPESWLVSAGRPSEPGAPLNVQLIPATNFIVGRGRQTDINKYLPDDAVLLDPSVLLVN